jgi:uncharacterized protein YqhQ
MTTEAKPYIGGQAVLEGVMMRSLFLSANAAMGEETTLSPRQTALSVAAGLGTAVLLLRIASRVALIPVVAGLSYEVIRAGARFRWFRPLVTLGMWLQRLTTRSLASARSMPPSWRCGKCSNASAL